MVSRNSWQKYYPLAILFVGMLALSGCATQPVVSNTPDLRVDPVVTPEVMTPEQQGAAIQELQNAASKNQGR